MTYLRRDLKILADLGALKSQMHALLGVGQPGRLQHMEERLARHERTVQRMKGVGGTLSVLFTILQVVLGLFKH